MTCFYCEAGLILPGETCPGCGTHHSHCEVCDAQPRTTVDQLQQLAQRLTRKYELPVFFNRMSIPYKNAYLEWMLAPCELTNEETMDEAIQTMDLDLNIARNPCRYFVVCDDGTEGASIAIGQ